MEMTCSGWGVLENRVNELSRELASMAQENEGLKEEVKALRKGVLSCDGCDGRREGGELTKRMN